MTTPATATPLSSAPRRWRRLLVALAVALTVLAALVAAIPWIAAPIVRGRIEEAVRRELDPGVEVSATAAISWSGPIGATVEASQGGSERFFLGVETPRGLTSWIGVAFGDALGEVPLVVSIRGRVRGDGAIGSWLFRKDETAASDGSGAAPAAPFRFPDGLSISLAGDVDLAVEDPSRGIDVAVRSDRLEFTASRSTGVQATVAGSIGRVAESQALPGRFSLEASGRGLFAADGLLAIPATDAVLVASASGLGLEWDGRSIAIDSLESSVRMDPAKGATLAATARGRVDETLTTVAADLWWRGPFSPEGRIRFDPSDVGGQLRAEGLPIGLASGVLPEDVGALVRELGEVWSIDLLVPEDPTAKVALAATTDRSASVAATAMVDRADGSLRSGEVRLEATADAAVVASLAGRDDLGVEGRLSLALEATGIEVPSVGDWTAGSAVLTLADSRPLLPMSPIELALDGAAPVEVRATAIRWTPGASIDRLEARGGLAFTGSGRARPLADRPAIDFGAIAIEWFAEPLGRSLSLRGSADVAGGRLSFEERLDGLWTGDRWLAATDLRPHGGFSVDSIDAGVVAAWLPEDLARVVEAQGLGRLSAQMLTRVEGDRLEGAVTAAADGLSLRVPISLDAQRLALGPSSLDATVRPGAVAALSGSAEGSSPLAEPTPLSVTLEPIVLPVAALRGELGNRPSIVGQVSLPRLAPTIAGLAPGASLRLEDAILDVSWPAGSSIVESRLGAELHARDPGGRDASLALLAADATLDLAATPSSIRGAVVVLDARLEPIARVLLAEPPGWLSDPAVVEWLAGETGATAQFSMSGGELGVEATLTSPAATARAKLGRSAAGDLAATGLGVESTVPVAVVQAIVGGKDASTVRLASAVRLDLASDRVAWSSEGRLETSGVTASTSEIDLTLVGPPDQRTRIAGISGSVLPRPDGGYDIRFGPRGSPPPGTARASFDGVLRLAAGPTDPPWLLDGRATLADWPTATSAVLLDDDGLLEVALGPKASFDATARGFGGDRGSVSLRMQSDNGRLDLPELAFSGTTASVPAERPLTASLRLTDALRRRLLARINPVFADVSTSQRDVQLRFSAAGLPIDGDRSRLDADLRLEVGEVRFTPGDLISLPLKLAGDAAAQGFDGLIAPLVVTVRKGQLAYEGFDVNFVRQGGGWKNTLRFAGRIDLTRAPPYAEAITTVYPGTSIAKYSADLRRLPPKALDALSVPVTFYGPLGEGSSLQFKIDLDLEDLLRRSVEVGIPILIDSILKPK